MAITKRQNTEYGTQKTEEKRCNYLKYKGLGEKLALRAGAGIGFALKVY
ncbi:MAG: hypothetical protein PHQ35_01410 [Phycisphaerae bacterium]|nr:hypothetical protein [Phycisphaerae bacterium]